METNDILNNWHTLNAVIMELSEAELDALMLAELEGQHRPRILSRLHHRFNRLRMLRERKELGI